MYARIVLAYDGTRQSRAALREGAILAKMCGAQIFLLSVVVSSGGLQIGESAFPGAMARERNTYRSILQDGVERLKGLGFDPVAQLVEGEPAPAISAFARAVEADLVVVGSYRQSAVARWWSGSTGASLLDNLGCSVLVARRELSDEEFQAALAAAANR